MSENKKIRFKLNKALVVIILITAFALTFLLGYFSRYLFENKNVNTISDIVRLIERAAYVIDPKTGERRELTTEELADAVVNALDDQYSAYYTPEEYERVTQAWEGNSVGVGISYYIDVPIISQVEYNSPAEKAGIKSGDRIVGLKKEGQALVPIQTSTEASEFFSTLQVGEKVVMHVDRGGQTYEFSFNKLAYTKSFVRYYDSQKCVQFLSEAGQAPILTESESDDTFSLDQHTAYICLTAFEGNAFSQVKQALSFMKERGRTKLILDLRGNGGGNVSIATDIASLFINNGGKAKSLVIHAQKNTGTEEFYTSSNNFQSFLSGVIVLANENTASASECLIGAMLHYGDLLNMDRVVIEKNNAGVAKTYGKGIMQTTYVLLSGGALKVTTGKVYWPDKQTSIHGVGIIPKQENAVDKGGALDRAIEISATV